MSRSPKIECDIDRKKFAADLRTIADEVEAGTIIAMGLVTCDVETEGGPACFMSNALTGEVYELIDQMVNALREAMKQTYEAYE